MQSQINCTNYFKLKSTHLHIKEQFSRFAQWDCTFIYMSISNYCVKVIGFCSCPSKPRLTDWPMQDPPPGVPGCHPPDHWPSPASPPLTTATQCLPAGAAHLREHTQNQLFTHDSSKVPGDHLCMCVCLTQVVSQGTGFPVGVKVVISHQFESHTGVVLSAGELPVCVLLLPAKHKQLLLHPEKTTYE